MQYTPEELLGMVLNYSCGLAQDFAGQSACERRYTICVACLSMLYYHYYHYYSMYINVFLPPSNLSNPQNNQSKMQ